MINPGLTALVSQSSTSDKPLRISKFKALPYRRVMEVKAILFLEVQWASLATNKLMSGRSNLSSGLLVWSEVYQALSGAFWHFALTATSRSSFRTQWLLPCIRQRLEIALTTKRTSRLSTRPSTKWCKLWPNVVAVGSTIQSTLPRGSSTRSAVASAEASLGLNGEYRSFKGTKKLLRSLQKSLTSSSWSTCNA